MKKREGFVPNSSSSSYICDVCGEPEEIADGDFHGSGWRECINDHIYHKYCAINSNMKKLGIESSECPICKMNAFKKDELLQFLLKTYKFDMDSIECFIKNRFESDYNKFKQFLGI